MPGAKTSGSSSGGSQARELSSAVATAAKRQHVNPINADILGLSRVIMVGLYVEEQGGQEKVWACDTAYDPGEIGAQVRRAVEPVMYCVSGTPPAEEDPEEALGGRVEEASADRPFFERGIPRSEDELDGSWF